MTVSGDFLYEDPYDPDNDLTSDEKADYYFMLNNGWGGIDTNPYTSVTADKEKEYYLEKDICFYCDGCCSNRYAIS